MPKVSVRLSTEVHAAVRTRAFREGVTLDELGRRFFEKYAQNGLSAGEQPGTGTSQGQSVVDPSGGGSASPTVGATGARPAPAEKPFVPDWKKGKR